MGSAGTGGPGGSASASVPTPSQVGTIAGGGASAPPMVPMPMAPTSPTTATPSADPAACDRACLTGILDDYYAALEAKDVSKLNVSSALKATENGVVTPFGMGVFESGGKVRADTRMDFADLQQGQIGSHVVFDDGDSMPVIYQVRLKVVAREVTEIETMVVRKQGASNGFFNVEGMKPQPVFKQPIEAEKRMSRDAMKAEVDRYFDALDTGDWMAAMTRFDDGCNRYENGVATARGASQIRSQSFNFDVQRRFLIFDEELGLVWGNFAFYPSDRTLVVGELFKVADAKILMIQAVMATIPAKAWQ